MSTRNLEWIRAEVCRVLSIDPTNIDSAFSGTADNEWEWVDSCILEALDIEMAELSISGDPSRLMDSQVVSWPVGQQKLTLPAPLDQADIIRVEDETHTTPGIGVAIYDRSTSCVPEVFWFDKNTLQWSAAGPGETKSLRFVFIAETSDLIGPSMEPIWIPRKFRWVLVWGAAILARDRQGESHPPVWDRNHIQWRERMQISFSKGRPRDTNPSQQSAAGSEFDTF